MNTHRYCVIMCGGIGSRFWPYSRSARPKQFIDFMGTGRSLLQMSYDRLLPIIPKENVLVLTNEAYTDLVHEQLPDLDPAQILAEPARRNTAPCIAWAAWRIYARDPQASIIVTPSDHLITGETLFVDSLRRGFEFVESHDALLTLGITPVRPETGYGYIHAALCESPHNALRIIRPPSGIGGHKVVQAALDHAHTFKIHRKKAKLSVRSLFHSSICTDGKRAGKDMSSVVIRMLADHVHPTRRKIYTRSVCIPIKLLKFF